ncbi:MAG TPA: hypothetical protein VM142_03630 [Acidimicrobiales bacterium]|nr:hypothetical protein [Acidimicrobiales bacterium]
MATNRRIFEFPAVADAFAFIDATTSQRHHLPVAPGPRHLALVRRLCEEADAAPAPHT